ncbi:hypothetical protein GCM10027167_41960 [Nocardia heshunensis]
MKIQLLGGPTGGNGSPRVWATDHGTDLIQGWPTGEPGHVEIPHQLLGYLELGTFLDAALRDSGRGTFTLAGRPVTDPNVLATMAIPPHETAIEVDVVKASYPHALSAQVR